MIKELEKQIADTRAKLLEKLATLKNKRDTKCISQQEHAIFF